MDCEGVPRCPSISTGGTIVGVVARPEEVVQKTLCDRCGQEVGPPKQEFMYVGIGKSVKDLCEGCRISLRLWYEEFRHTI